MEVTLSLPITPEMCILNPLVPTPRAYSSVYGKCLGKRFFKRSVAVELRELISISFLKILSDLSSN